MESFDDVAVVDENFEKAGYCERMKLIRWNQYSALIGLSSAVEAMEVGDLPASCLKMLEKRESMCV